jgi:hypothetical protein
MAAPGRSAIMGTRTPSRAPLTKLAPDHAATNGSWLNAVTVCSRGHVLLPRES